MPLWGNPLMSIVLLINFTILPESYHAFWREVHQLEWLSFAFPSSKILQALSQ
jgi:hypothetical protein